jgi:hypothetical protein
MYDKFATLAMESTIAVAFLANEDVTDIELLPLRPNTSVPEKLLELERLWAPRGLGFFGTMGIVRGRPRVELVRPLDDRRIQALAEAFAVYCETLLPGHIEEQRKGDEVEWLERLWSLPDPRSEL